MKTKVENNTIKTNDLEISPLGLIPDVAYLKDIRYEYERESDGRVTDKIIGTRYSLISPADFSTFVIKVPLVSLLVSVEELEKAETPIKVRLPVKEMTVRVYKIEYGKAYLSITAPYLKLAE